MMHRKETGHRPGDGIIDRYMPHANSEARDEAHENLRRFARLLIRIEDRRAREWYAKRIREDGGATVESGAGPSPPV